MAVWFDFVERCETVFVDRKGIRPVKSWVLVYWWWRFDWSLARIYLQLSPPPPSSLAPIKPANPASPGKMAEKNGECCEKNSSWWYNMILSTAVTSALWLLVCSDVSVSWWNLGQRLLTQWSASVNRSPLHSRWFEPAAVYCWCWEASWPSAAFTPCFMWVIRFAVEKCWNSWHLALLCLMYFLIHYSVPRVWFYKKNKWFCCLTQKVK